MILGRGGGSSEVTVTAGEWGGDDIMPSGESKRVEGVKRTPYGRDAEDVNAGGCS